jgi:hypothetical protein
MEKRNIRGQFLKVPEGVKTKKMLEVERRIGRPLEEDFKENYIKRGWGQKRLANHWGVKKELVFAENLLPGRTCWVKKLKLEGQVRRLRDAENTLEPEPKGKRCELCKAEDLALDKAHWVSRASGGSSRRFNILSVCPNCHRKLHYDDKPTLKKACEVLLLREATKVIEGKLPEDQKRNLLYELSQAIIKRVPLSGSMYELII